MAVTERALTITLAITLLVGALWAWVLHSGAPVPVSSPEETRRATHARLQRDAVGFCQSVVEERAHDPGAVRFDDANTFQVTAVGEHGFAITLGLRARNGFGALRHTQVRCEVEWLGGERWRIHRFYTLL